MIYNVHYGISALLILIIYYAFIKIQYSTKDKRNFIWMILAICIADIFDIITAFTISYGHSVPITVNYVANTAYFIFSVIGVYCFPNYVRNIIHGKSYKLMDKVNLGLLIIYIFICFCNYSTGIIFYFSKEGKYYHGPYYYIIYCLTVYYMVFSFCRMLYHRKSFSAKQLYSILIFIASSQVGTFVQVLFFPNVLLTYFTPAIGAFIILLAFETPDYKLLIRTADDLKRSREELELSKSREAERSRLLHEYMRTASWEIYLDEEGNVLSATWSPEFKRMLGYSDDYDCMESQLWVDSLYPDDKDETVNAFYNGMTFGVEYNREFRLVDKNGNIRWYLGTGEGNYDDKHRLLSYKGIIRDIHDEKIKSILIQERLAALEELEKSQEALKIALASAEDANKAKSTFLTNMSHDIRTPMNAIIGFTDLAIENKNNPIQVSDYLVKIKTAGNHLVSLINDILDMNRIESGKMLLEQQPNNLKNLLTDIHSIVQSNVESGKLEYIENFDKIESSYVFCDALRLNQILLNCIGNSIKFTPKGGRVTIEAEETATSSKVHDFTFKISDTGIGMSKEFLQKIFEPFERERTSTISKTQGTGLGMSITKALVDMMNGRIKIDSVEGEGTTYTFTLPFEILSPEEIQSLNENKNDENNMEMMLEAIKGLHCLVVDDNSVNRLLAKKLLNSRSITNEEASDGQDAYEIIKNAGRNYYDFILMDIQMPIVNGYEATDMIRAIPDPSIASIPIIALTADAFEEDKKRCIEHGMNSHISKPIIIEELVNAIYDVVIKDRK